MARVVVDVMLKPEILDPQGKAVHGAFGRLGFDGVADVRQGKRFEITLDGELTEERVAQIRTAAETLLANPVIEDFTVHAELGAAEPATETGQETDQETDAEADADAEVIAAGDPEADEPVADAEATADSEESDSEDGEAAESAEPDESDEAGSEPR